MNLLEQGLRVSPTTRRKWLSNLTASQRRQLQNEMTDRQKELGIAWPPTSATASAPSKMSNDRLDALRNRRWIGGRRVLNIGRHQITVSSTARTRKMRDTLAYVYEGGRITGYSARGAKLVRLKMDAATLDYIAREVFHLKI